MISGLLLSLCLVLEPTVASVSMEPLPFDPAAWAAEAQVELRVMEEGKAVLYTGVPLAIVLKESMQGGKRIPALRRLSDAVIVVTASDDYQAAFSAAAVAMDPKGERYLLALRRDGQPLGQGQGPVRVIAAGDPERVRWVRMVTSLRLARFRAAK